MYPNEKKNHYRYTPGHNPSLDHQEKEQIHVPTSKVTIYTYTKRVHFP